MEFDGLSILGMAEVEIRSDASGLRLPRTGGLAGAGPAGEKGESVWLFRGGYADQVSILAAAQITSGKQSPWCFARTFPKNRKKG
jgi:hypothetical protein